MTLAGGEQNKKVEGVGAKDLSAGSLGESQAELKQLDQELQKLIREEVELGKEVREQKKPDAENLAKYSRHFPRLIQRTLQKMDASQVYRSFKLAGKDYVVHDRRDLRMAGDSKEDPKAGEIKKESKTPLEELMLQKGKLFAVKERGYENYLADPTQRMQPSEQEVAGERLLNLLNLFEKKLLKRFEEGEEILRRQPEGRFSFLEKTANQWRLFFSRFIQRTVKRHVPIEKVAEWIYRGFVQKSNRGTVISDLALLDGRMEKFIRFRLSQEGQNIASFFNQLQPGARLANDQLKRFLTGNLEYLAIKEPRGESDFAMAFKKGKFLETAQAEAKVASDLGLQLAEQMKEKERVLREFGARQKKGEKGFAGSGGGGWGEGTEYSEGEKFVPWWQYGLKKKPIPWGWTLLFFVFLCGILIGLSALF